MAGRCMVVAAFKNGPAEGVVCRDIDTALVCEDAGLNLPVGEAGTEGKRNVLMHGLECLEDEGVTCRGGHDAVREGGVDQVNKEGWWEEGDVGVVGVIRREEVGSAGEGVGSSEKFAGNMDHLKVEVGKVDEPARLAAVECLGLVKISKVLVVGEDLYREGGAMEIVTPGLQGANNSEKFPIINVVITFGGGEGL